MTHASDAATPQQQYRIGDFVNEHGLTDRGWILHHAQAPDGALVKVGGVHKGWKLTREGWRPAKGWENTLNSAFFIVGG